MAKSTRRISADIADRFWAKVEKSEGCWEWTAGRDKLGYGRFCVAKKNKYAHRVAYELTRGPVPPGLELDHLCRNTGCVNPAHLEPVLHKVNVLRGEGAGAAAARRGSCARGHVYTQESTYVRGGRHYCLVCKKSYYEAHRDKWAEWADRRRLALS